MNYLILVKVPLLLLNHSAAHYLKHWCPSITISSFQFVFLETLSVVMKFGDGNLRNVRSRRLSR